MTYGSARWAPFVVLAVLLAPTAADTIHLKSGDTVIGRITRRHGFLEVRTASGVVKISDKMVDRIEWDSGSAASGAGQRTRPGAVGPSNTRSPAPADSDSWRAKYEAAMKQKINLDFTDSAVLDCFDFLRDISGLNIILSPDAAEAAAEKQITLRVNNMDVQTALKWVLRLSKLHSTVKHHAIYITDRPDPQHQMRTHNVRDLLFSTRDAGSIEFNAPSSSGGLSGIGGGDEDEEYNMPQRAGDLMVLIMTLVQPTSWGFAFVSGAGEDEVDFGDFF